MPNNQKKKKVRGRYRLHRNPIRMAFNRFNMVCRETSESLNRMSEAMRALRDGKNVVLQGGRGHSKGLFINGILIHLGSIDSVLRSGCLEPDKRKAAFSKTIVIPAYSYHHHRSTKCNDVEQR